MPETLVIGADGGGVPYSKWLMGQSLSAAGVAPERAYELARAIERDLDRRRRATIPAAELHALTEDLLAAQEGPDAVVRYRAWRRLAHLDRPLVVLLGGTAGVGKSTLATLLAGRLGVTRVIPTDVIREVLRASFSPAFLPAVHVSSFEAASAVRVGEHGGDGDLVGFARQAEHVGTGVTAIVERAIAESMSVVVEGVHLVPGLVDRALGDRCVLVEALLVLEDEERHRAHFPLRGGARPADRYLERLPEIRKLQRFLVDRARGAGMPVVRNDNLDEALAGVLDLVIEAVGRLPAS